MSGGRGRRLGSRYVVGPDAEGAGVRSPGRRPGGSRPEAAVAATNPPPARACTRGGVERAIGVENALGQDPLPDGDVRRRPRGNAADQVFVACRESAEGLVAACMGRPLAPISHRICSSNPGTRWVSARRELRDRIPMKPRTVASMSEPPGATTSKGTASEGRSGIPDASTRTRRH